MHADVGGSPPFRFQEETDSMSSVRAPMVRAAWMCLLVAAPAMAEWKVLPPTGERSGLPQSIPGDAQTIRPGDSWPQDNQFRWLIGELKIPAEIDNQSTAGKPVGIRINCGDGGEVFLNGRFQSRYDNDHPALVLVAEKAVPGTPVHGFLGHQHESRMIVVV
ncbi:MAG TPA: hypothetical protein PLT93_12935, partial [Phycisphaerae bacterium]|nr:hypothetical protein [Phycisphaerae bacterium]